MICAVLLKVLNNKDKVDYILGRIPLKRLAEPEDFVGELTIGKLCQ